MSVHKRQTKAHGTVYDVRLRDPDRRLYSRTFPTKREALDYEADQRTARNRGAWIAASTATASAATSSRRVVWIRAISCTRRLR